MSACVNSLKTVNAEIITLSTQTMKKLKCSVIHSIHERRMWIDLKKKKKNTQMYIFAPVAKVDESQSGY